jgi:hypothetical protein
MPIDWVAEMFRALRDCGEDIAIIFARLDDEANGKTSAPLWKTLAHDEYDGVSGFSALLAQMGVSPGAMPVLREGRASWRRRARGLLAVLRMMPVRRQRWRLSFDWERRVSFLPPHMRVAWTLFDAAQTAALVSAAKSAGVTVNTLLLHHLDTAVRAQWVAPGADTRWMLPVNMRGAVTRPASNPPHMSFLAADLAAMPPTLPELQGHIDRALSTAQHWGMWSLLQLGRVLGEKGMRADIRKRERQGHGATGMFSNLGVWNTEGAGHWLFCPAITRVYPIGAGCITVNGRLALTLQLHDALGGSLDSAQATLDDWVRSCTAAIASTAPCDMAQPSQQSTFVPA